MSTSYYIKFDGVEGESTHKDHQGEIEVLSWSWGLANSGSTGSGGASVGKAKPTDFRFVHHYDKASPLLARAAIGGRAFKQVSMTARKAGTGQKDFMKVTMKEVFITSLSDNGNQDSGVGEEIAVQPRHIEVQYQAQDAKGVLGSPVSFSWDIALNSVK
jgi:type VI secretion system secreted protein Hcp